MSAADNTYNAESIHTELSDDNNQTVKEGSSKSEVTQQPTDSAVGLQDSIIFTVDKDASKDNILTSTASSELVENQGINFDQFSGSSDLNSSPIIDNMGKLKEYKSFYDTLKPGLSRLKLVPRKVEQAGIELPIILFAICASNIFFKKGFTGALSEKISENYKFLFAIQTGMLCQFLSMLYRIRAAKYSINVPKCQLLFYYFLSSSTVMLLLEALTDDNYIAGIAWGLGVCVASDLLFNEILRNAKNSFTIGEAAVISEGIIMFIAYTLRLLFDDIECNWIEENRISFYAIAFPAITVVIGSSTYLLPICKSPIFFYPVSCIAFGGLVFIPIYDISMIDYLLTEMRSNGNLIIFIALCIVCTCLAIIALTTKTFSGSSTVIRKLFHLFIVIIYIPGYSMFREFTILATSVLFAIMCMVELIRVMGDPLGCLVEKYLRPYVDEKDSGVLIMSHIYLLTACAIPLWLHPNALTIPKDLSINSLVLLSGILSVGIGDSTASIMGKKFGKIKLPWMALHGNCKTIDGALYSCLVQILSVVFLQILGLVWVPNVTVPIVVLAIAVNATYECVTLQNDNLALPLITLAILSPHFD